MPEPSPEASPTWAELIDRCDQLAERVAAHLRSLHHMPPHTRYRGYTLTLDTELNADPVLHLPQCAVCGSRGPECLDAVSAQDWAFRHLASHPTHFRYRTRITVPQRLVPGSWS